MDLDVDDDMPIVPVFNQPLDMINKIGISRYEEAPTKTQNTLKIEKITEVSLRVNTPLKHTHTPTFLNIKIQHHTTNQFQLITNNPKTTETSQTSPLEQRRDPIRHLQL